MNEFMARAIDEARNGIRNGDGGPFGAIVVRNGSIVASGHNRVVSGIDPTAHAEIMALRAGSQALHNYRLNDTTLYVTLEPCTMCAGAMIHARVSRLVYGAIDPKTGAAGSVTDIFGAAYVNHRVAVEGGILAQECGILLASFFKDRRQKI